MLNGQSNFSLDIKNGGCGYAKAKVVDDTLQFDAKFMKRTSSLGSIVDFQLDFIRSSRLVETFTVCAHDVGSQSYWKRIHEDSVIMLQIDSKQTSYNSI